MAGFDRGLLKWPRKWLADPELRPFLNDFAKTDYDVKTNFTASQLEMAAQQSDLSTLTTAVNGNTTTLVSLQAEVDAAQTDLISIDSRVDNLYSELDILVTNYGV